MGGTLHSLLLFQALLLISEGYKILTLQYCKCDRSYFTSKASISNHVRHRQFNISVRKAYPISRQSTRFRSKNECNSIQFMSIALRSKMSNDEEQKYDAKLEAELASKEELEAAKKFAKECDAEWFSKYIAEEDSNEFESYTDSTRVTPTTQTISNGQRSRRMQSDFQNAYENEMRMDRTMGNNIGYSMNSRKGGDQFEVNELDILVYELGYSEEDAFSLSQETIEILIEKRIPRPKGVIPSDWKRWQSSSALTQQGGSSWSPNDRGCDQYYGTKERRNVPQHQRRGQHYDEDEEELLALPTLDEFKDMLRKETEWRLGITGGWAADLVRTENRMRLAVYDSLVQSLEETKDDPGIDTPGAMWDRRTMKWVLEDPRLEDPFQSNGNQRKDPYLPGNRNGGRRRNFWEKFDGDISFEAWPSRENFDGEKILNGFDSWPPRDAYSLEQRRKESLLADIDAQLKSRKASLPDQRDAALVPTEEQRKNKRKAEYEFGESKHPYDFQRQPGQQTKNSQAFDSTRPPRANRYDDEDEFSDFV